MNWYVKVLKQYVDFSGRARRREYWMFVLVNVVILIVLSLIDTLLGTGGFRATSGGGSFYAANSLGLLSGLYTLAVLLPSIAVTVRRLHDTDRTRLVDPARLHPDHRRHRAAGVLRAGGHAGAEPLRARPEGHAPAPAY